MKDFQEITKKTYNTVAENWDKKRQYYWKPVVEFIESFENKNDLKFLDLGCGTGRHLELAQKKGFKKENIFGSDYSKGQLEVVKQKGFQTILSDMQNLEIKDKEFDSIVCIAAHHHLLEKKTQLQSLKEMKRILNEDGKILLANWFPEKDFVDQQIQKGKFLFENENKQIVKVFFISENKKHDRYYYLFKETELIELCKEADFTITKREYNKGNLYLTLN
ncbi:MAG: methyltransferase domain-containing protein [Candidatus Woesearchaeota archaeon]|jgi:tRNA (uracil-5-)-methyltransferase TRM9|nr:methyltransferase domain-containing protein [Candidatus Woesearchaeota archaeon]